jgi:hypothetical protein
MTTLTFQQDLPSLETEDCATKIEPLSCSCDNCGQRAERLALRCLIPIVLASALYVYGMLDGAPEGLLNTFERFAYLALVPGMLAGIACISVYALWKSRRRSTACNNH